MSGYIGSTPVPQATQHRESFTATEGQTSFATAGYTPQFVDVYLNGSHLSPADFVATNGSDVVLVVAASADDVCDIISYSPFEVAGATFTGTTAVDVATVGGTLAVTGVVTANAGVVVDEMTLDADTLTATDDFIIDAAGDIILDADDGDIILKDGGTIFGQFSISSGDLFVTQPTQDKDIIFRGNDNDSFISALTLDMSDEGAAIFNSTIKLGTNRGIYIGGTGSANYLEDYEEGTFTISMTGASTSRTNAQAVYTKVGNLVTFSYYTLSSSVSSTSGYATITGLPFTAKNHNSADVPCTIANNTFFGGSATVGQQAFVAKNSTIIYFMNTGTASQASFVNGSSKYLGITGTYMTA